MNHLFKSVSRARMAMRWAALGACLTIASGCTAFGKCDAGCTADAKITAEVRQRFAQSPELGGPNAITVQTIHGVVYLRGLVSTPYQISAAGSIAEGAPGVVEVQNLLYIDNAH